MRIVIAPDSFKESLSAAEVAEALGKGAVGACPSAGIDLCPMADGGEGAVDAMVAATEVPLLPVPLLDCWFAFVFAVPVAPAPVCVGALSASEPPLPWI